MYELIRAAGNTYYMDCPAKVGLVVSGDGCVAIDSGSDDSAAKKLLRHVDSLALPLKAVYVTHSHADHIGGCALMQKRTGCRVYAPGLELAFTRIPSLELIHLYGGRAPASLHNKFLEAQPCSAEELTRETLPAGFTAVPLPGHSFDQTGILTPDGVLFAADSVSSAETLDKYGICFLYDVKKSLESLDVLDSTPAALYVPAHAPAVSNIRELSRLNRVRIQEIAGYILSVCGEGGLTFEEILEKVLLRYGMDLSLQQYALTGSTIRSYLSYLADEGRLIPVGEKGRLLWRVKQEG